MKKELTINGIREINGKEIKVIEGGFGENQKCITAKQISEIHGVETKYINKLINNNIKRFKENIDIIDLKTSSYEEPVLEMLFTKAQIGNAKNIYVLSERGYSKIIKIMDTDLAWDIHDELIDNYFTMRQALQEANQPKLPTTFKEALLMLVEAEEEKERLQLENETITLEKRLLSGEVFEWAGRSCINALVRLYAQGDFSKAWTDYKKEILYKHGININSRITNYLNKSGKKTKPKTLDMLNDEELPNAIATIISMCNEKNIDVSETIRHYSK